ncbi:MAG: lipopolysaccharide biosynthesis protein [Candidatus Zhuqueibacterota bacterium]
MGEVIRRNFLFLSKIVDGKKYRSVSIFSISSIILNFSNLISGFLVYKWIDPYFMGIWQSMVLLQTYSSFARFGVINGMNRELPFSLGQGDVEKSRKYAETALYYNLLNTIIFTIVFISAFSFFKIRDDWYLPLLTIATIILVAFYDSYLLGTFRANADFDKLSIIQFINAFIKLVSLVFVFFYGFDGFCIREIITIVVLTAITHFLRPIKVKPKFDLHIIKILLKTGFPIFLGSYFFNSALTIPRLVILKFGSIESLGFYSPVVTLINALMILPNSIATYYYPKFAFHLGVTNKKVSLWRKSKLIHISLVLIGLPVLIFGWFSFPIIVRTFIPRYIESIFLLKIGLIIGLFSSFKFGFTTLATLKSWKYMAIYIVSFILVQTLFPILFLNFFDTLKAAVLGQLVAAVFMFGISLFTNYSAAHENE